MNDISCNIIQSLRSRLNYLLWLNVTIKSVSNAKLELDMKVQLVHRVIAYCGFIEESEQYGVSSRTTIPSTFVWFLNKGRPGTAGTHINKRAEKFNEIPR
jgi:hypothetical protein